MPNDRIEATQQQRLCEILLRHLQVAACPRWPGADGLTVEEVLQSYPHAAAAGRVPSQAQLLAAHPELRDELLAFFRAAGRSTC